MTPDTELLKRYAAERDETSFAELVRRHLDHVYSTALRLVNNDSHLAEDVAQSVFADLAMKSGSLCNCAALSSWLHTSARFAAAKVVRGEQRRRQREQTAFTTSTMLSTSPPDWEQMRPFLDDTIGELSDADRDAILLRYFERKPYAEVGAALGLSENGARMRVDRAIEKLRSRLLVRGVTSTSAALGTALAQNVVGTAPAGLAARLVGRATIAGITASANSASWLGSGIRAGRLAMVATGVLILATLGLWLKPKLSAGRSASKQEAVVNAPGDITSGTISQVHVVSRKAAGQNVNPAFGLTLFFVDDKTGRPITNQVIGLRGWERNEQLLVEKEVKLEQGQCAAPFERDAKSRFWILTRIEGYADVRLRWNPKRGEVIPEFYTVRLVRPALIQGRVVDPSGNPVAGATVGFNTEQVSGTDASPEDHCIDYLKAQTDADGRWQMNRIAPEMVRRLFGGASHPEFPPSEQISVSRQPQTERQLLEGALIFHLAQGIILNGTIVKESGQPIANASVHVGVVDSSGSKDMQTLTDGSFTIKGCRAGKGVVSAEADGFAPTAINLELEPKLQPVRLMLGPGKPLVVRVTDTAGRPIAKATIDLDSFPRSGRTVPVPQVEFRRETDEDGRLVWTNAPEQNLPFRVSASSYMHTDVTLKPDAQEHQVTLQPGFVIYGTVRDPITGELVPRFRMDMGWPQTKPDGSVQPQWSDIERFSVTFTGGEFRHTLQEGVVGGTLNPGYVFRFEADGHAPFVTRVYQADEGEVQLDVQLHPAEEIRVLAYTPEGQVAHDAQVAFLTPGSDVKLVPGGFAGPLGYALESIKRVDSQGWFVVAGSNEIQRVIIAHPSGYAEANLDQLKKDHAVRLGHWASLEGVWQTNGQPVANAEISMQWAQHSTIRPILDWEAFHTVSDAEGHFAFPQVPCGSLLLWAGLTKSGEREFQKLVEVELVAGEAKQVRIQEPLAEPAQ